MHYTSLSLRMRRWFFAHTSRFGRNACIELIPGCLSCVMATVLGYAMSLDAKSIPRHDWFGLAAYIAIGIWFLVRGVVQLGRDTVGERLMERSHKGLCQHCGFDLRACTSVRCSECGAWHGKSPGRFRGINDTIGEVDRSR